ncbi:MULTISPECIES: hypothetical protein [Niastella]|uniref:Uncharacterized protein n=1 Tax=Niastella soli TaxID=2821487 RepID=A0ABS3Z0Y6_9BACT|nr:hypothetical protein [Niastella soli]MBO9203683.1 hypothetical protein [Niastella soli]
MEIFKKVSEELFGNEFLCMISSNGITLVAKDNSKAFCFGLVSDAGFFRIREMVYAIKRFEVVEAILQPLLEKYEIPQCDREMKEYGIDFNGTIRKRMSLKDIPVVNSLLYGMAPIDGADEEQIRTVLTVLKKAIGYLETEFIDRYKTVRRVYYGQEEMTTNELDRFFTSPYAIRKLVIEALCYPAKDPDSIFEKLLTDYEEVETELPGMYKEHYLVTLELLRYFREQKKV